jgi:hypothetical protein
VAYIYIQYRHGEASKEVSEEGRMLDILDMIKIIIILDLIVRLNLYFKFRKTFNEDIVFAILIIFIFNLMF